MRLDLGDLPFGLSSSMLTRALCRALSVLAPNTCPTLTRAPAVSGRGLPEMSSKKAAHAMPTRRPSLKSKRLRRTGVLRASFFADI